MANFVLDLTQLEPRENDCTSCEVLLRMDCPLPELMFNSLMQDVDYDLTKLKGRIKQLREEGHLETNLIHYMDRAADVLIAQHVQNNEN